MERLRIAALVVLVVLFSSCQNTSDRAGSPEDTDNPAYGDVLVIGTEADADALNPLVSVANTGSDVYGQLFCQLARIKPDMKDFEPWLATRWEFSPDRRTLTFQLRDDVTWHDGEKFSAHDVVFSFDLYSSEEIGWKTIRWLEDIESVTAVDSFAVRFDFRQAYPDQFFDAWIFRPLPRHILQNVSLDAMRTADFNRQPIGNGPFRFISWIPQQRIELAAYDGYFEGRPFLDRLVWKVIPDATSLATQLGNGQIDLWPVVPSAQKVRVRELPNINVHSYPSRVYHYVCWNIADPLFSDRSVRRALSMAIDRQKIIDSLLDGMGRPAMGPIPSFLWAHNPDLKQIPFDPQQAVELLAREGWVDRDGDGWLDRDGQPFEFEIITNGDNQIRADITVVLQEDLRKIGIKVVPRLVEWTVFVERLTRKKDFQAAVSAWVSAIKVDLTTIWHSRSIMDKYNIGHYANPGVDSLIDHARVELDRETARDLWGRAQQIIVDDAPYTFLFVTDEVVAVDGRVRNVRPTTYSWDYNLCRWWVPTGEQRYPDW
ncbi:MAG: peptide-binding protein [Candidatus Eisenbacteria sp.]|nr:peptide-binding protein [Candidatus Eisenbacteria bacterium]